MVGMAEWLSNFLAGPGGVVGGEDAGVGGDLHAGVGHCRRLLLAAARRVVAEPAARGVAAAARATTRAGHTARRAPAATLAATAGRPVGASAALDLVGADLELDEVAGQLLDELLKATRGSESLSTRCLRHRLPAARWLPRGALVEPLRPRPNAAGVRRSRGPARRRGTSRRHQPACDPRARRRALLRPTPTGSA